MFILQYHNPSEKIIISPQYFDPGMSYSQAFGRFSFLKKEYSLPLRVQDLLEYMQKVLHHEQKSIFACSSKKRTTVDSHFARAFSTMNKREQVAMFESYLDYLECYVDKKPLPQDQLKKDSYEFQALIRQGTFGRSWQPYKLQIDANQLQLTITGNHNSNLDLRDYLIRSSKSNDKPCFVLEATRVNQRKTTRIGFDSEVEYEKCYHVISMLIRRAQFKNLERHMVSYEQLRKSMEKKKSGAKGKAEVVQEPKEITNKPFIDLEEEVRSEDSPRIPAHEITIVDQLLEDKEKIDIIEKIANQNDVAQQLKKQGMEKSVYFLSVVKTDQSKSFGQQIQQIKRKKDLDIFHRLMPDYDLSQIQQQRQFRLIRTVGKFRILRHDARLFMYRLSGVVSGDLRSVMAALLDTSKYRVWNEEVQLGDIKIRIIAENSAIMYQKHKAYNRFYRARDYLYLRHVFAEGSYHYVIDKSIENSHFPPFSSIIRGNMRSCIWCLRERKDETEITMEVDVAHEGFLTVEQQEQLTERYLIGLTNIQSYLKQNKGAINHIDKCFDLEWDIGRNSVNVSMIRSKRRSKSLKPKPTIFLKQSQQDSQFSQNLCSQIEQPEYFTAHGGQSYQQAIELTKQIPDKQLPRNSRLISQQQKKQISEPQQNIQVQTDCELDSNGLVVLPFDYLRKKNRQKPLDNCEWKPLSYPQFKHYLLKDQWVIQHKVGLHFVNEKKIQAQKGVLKFILNKLGKNILSGKGIAGVSLPVDIFAPLSYLEETARSFGLAPKLLEKACKSKDPLERMKYVVIFALSHSINFILMEKPFNPILGETFQGWLNGCPIVLQQISHHPPISAFYMIGRGYKIYGNFQAKLDLGINSGVGTNTGEYIIEFEDTHQKVRFRPHGGEITGVTYGARTFNFCGKELIYDYDNNLFCEIVFNPTKKGFFSMGKQQKQSDYLEGTIVKTKGQWMQQFKKSNHKKDGPSQKNILTEQSKVNGIWTEYVKIDGIEYYNLEKDAPCILEYEKYPLNSNSSYREDIIYLEAKDLARAQVEKDRLEEIQRADKKLRTKFGKNHHHH